MTKYGAFFLIIAYMLFVIFVVQSIPNMSVGGLPNLNQQTPPTGLLFILDAIIGFLGTFWAIMTFSVTGLPNWISMTFVLCSFMMFLMIVSLIRGTD